jgi:hypothetical protein
MVAGCASRPPSASSKPDLPPPAAPPATAPVAAPTPAPPPQSPAPAPPASPVLVPHPTSVAPAAAPAKPKVQASTAPNKPALPVAAKPQPPAAPTLDLASLEQRLKDTRAIGVFTKLSLKNQVDDLLGEFRALYKNSNQHPGPELRQRYDLLLLKVLSLLQDGDPPLAAAISSSKEAIWNILADPDKFAKI